MVDLAGDREGVGRDRSCGGLVRAGDGGAAAVGLVLYFTGAVVAVLRAKLYGHVAFPLIYMASAVAVLALA
ncbi:hypothetical protein GCM10010492_16240 [Saccharothrix mutabilis subsp. mutabilis]|uniref:Undecaprenyl-diphosphatase n=1 Tax=Saccharothrix mutabilis subsp. mutabilis TaxID=66855 RepID=A0ABN0TDM7_9PSEU